MDTIHCCLTQATHVSDLCGIKDSIYFVSQLSKLKTFSGKNARDFFPLNAIWLSVVEALYSSENHKYSLGKVMKTKFWKFEFEAMDSEI